MLELRAVLYFFLRRKHFCPHTTLLPPARIAILPGAAGKLLSPGPIGHLCCSRSKRQKQEWCHVMLYVDAWHCDRTSSLYPEKMTQHSRNSQVSMILEKIGTGSDVIASHVQQSSLPSQGSYWLPEFSLATLPTAHLSCGQLESLHTCKCYFGCSI